MPMHPTHDDDDCDLDAADRRALALVRAPAPPGGFVARTLARIDAERPAPRVRRGMGGIAAAAVAAMMLGGLVSAQLLSRSGAALDRDHGPGRSALPHPGDAGPFEPAVDGRPRADGREI